MSDTHNSKNGPPAGEEIAEDKIFSPEMPERETIETPQPTAEMDKEKGFLGEVGEKAAELTDVIVDKLKKGLSQAYETGAKVVDELSQAAQKYVEKYKTETEIKKLKGEKDELTTQMGQAVFKHHLAGGEFTESFFVKKEIIDQFNQIEVLDEKIIETGRQLDKGKE